MITANEFRIGNLVMIDNKIITVAPNDIFNIYIADLALCINEYEPIELTDEWLIKFGLQYDTVTFFKGSIMLVQNTNNDKYSVWYKSLAHGRLDIEISYVHELQNLFFALTKTELTYD